MIDAQKIKQLRADFPFFEQTACVYLDNGATSQKPRQVIDRMMHWYAYECAPVSRAIYRAAEQATQQYEDARGVVAHFIGAKPCEVIFTSGATDSINVVAISWARQVIEPGDEIIVSQLEHHANFIVWQQLALEKNARLLVIPITPDGLLDMAAYERMLSPKTKLVAITHESNVLGTIVDVARIARQAHAVGARVLVDAAQSAPHQPIDVLKLGADFLAFSGHKMLGPTGIGVLYIKQELYDRMVPHKFGGGMAHAVCLERSTWASAPHKFEAGTQPIAQALGLAQAIKYLTERLDFTSLCAYEAGLITHAIDGLSRFEQVRILGPVEQLKQTGHLVSCVIDGIHPHDVAAFLDQQDVAVAVRAGQQCAQPLHTALVIPASIRVSVYLYTTADDIDLFIGYIARLLTK